MTTLRHLTSAMGGWGYGVRGGEGEGSGSGVSLAVAPFARLELAREGHASAGTPGNPGSPLKKVDGLTFFSSGPVSRVQSRVVRQFLANRNSQ